MFCEHFEDTYKAKEVKQHELWNNRKKYYYISDV